MEDQVRTRVFKLLSLASQLVKTSRREMFYNQFLIGLAVFTCAMTVLLALDSNFKDAGLCVLVCSLASQLVIQRSKICEMNKENKILRKWAYSSLKYDKKESTQPKRQAV